MKVFLAATSLLPDYGGPAVSVSRLAMELAGVGCRVGVWASDQSVTRTPLLPASSSVQRLIGSAKEALTVFGNVDIIHDNGIWLPHNHFIAHLSSRRSIPRVVSTRGMVEPWAMNSKKWKKQLAWWSYQKRDLERAQCHHATADTEAKHIDCLRLGVPICVIPNGMDVRICLGKKEKGIDEQKVALFLSRIHPKKGLLMLIEAWAKVRPNGWTLQIAGPDEIGHIREVEAEILAAGLGNVISFIGALQGIEKERAFLNADLFVLPTYSENFGIVVAEALAYGIPVLTTTGAPWSVLLHKNCGWWVKPTVGDIAHGLKQAISCDSGMLAAMGRRGRAWVEKELSWGRIAGQFIQMYRDVLKEAGI